MEPRLENVIGATTTTLALLMGTRLTASKWEVPLE